MGRFAIRYVLWYTTMIRMKYVHGNHKGKMMLKVFMLSLLMMHTLYAQKITIAVAANVSYVIEALQTEFHKEHPRIELQIILGSSGKLTAQIINGAPYGMFMSADMGFPQRLYQQKMAINEPVVYAQGGIAYLSMRSQDFSKGMELLADANIKKIAIANPKTAPYGAAALEAMKRAKLYTRIQQKLVYAESITQTVAYIMHAAEIGIVSKSSLYSPKMKRYKEGVYWQAVDPALYSPIKQGVVLLKESKKDKAYQLFYDFVLSDKAKVILKKYGYTI